MHTFVNQVAVITGASKGIGRVIAETLAQQGMTVVLASRDQAGLSKLANTIEEAGGRALAVPTDVSDEKQVVALFEKVDAVFGRVDLLINNAGIGIFGPVAEYASEDFDQVINVNLRGAFICSREAVRRMIAAKTGYIVNISSVVGIKGYPNQAAYTASKHGMLGLTKSLAVETQEHGIRVSAILPGGVDTDMVGDARPDLDRSILIPPEDIAQTVLYLLNLSERSHVDQIYIRRRTSSPF